MVYWKIRFDDGTFGWQVMDDELGNSKVVDNDGNEVTEPVGYSWFSDTEVPPFAPQE
jgi:hypothetical protein